MSTTKIPIRTVYDGSNNPVGLAEYQVDEVVPISHGGTSANSVANARSNLSVSDSNIRSLFSVSGGGSYDNSTGIITINSTDLTPFAKSVDLTTANVVEITNLYFTNARSIASLVGQSVSMGDATITGNLLVLGNVVEFSTETLTIEDKNIVLANGSPSASASNGAGITIDGANASLIYFSEDDKWEFNKDLSVEGSIAATGNITSPFFYSESDITLKEGVSPIQDALKKVTELIGVDFIWKTTKQKSIGVIAQNVEQVIPEIVGKSSAGLKTVQYDSIIPLLIEAIKDQQKQIEELRSKIK